MIVFRHCEIYNSNSHSIGNIVPALQDCIIHDCGGLVDTSNNYSPAELIKDYHFISNCKQGISLNTKRIGFEFNVFYNIVKGVENLTLYSDLLSSDLTEKNIYFYRNTFINMESIIESFDNRAKILTEYNYDYSAFVNYILFEGNITFGIFKFGSSNLLPFYLVHSLINGSIQIDVLNTFNIFENGRPIFIDEENHNYRLIHAGMNALQIASDNGLDSSINTDMKIQLVKDSIPLFDSIGVCLSGSYTMPPGAVIYEDSGAYLNVVYLTPKLSKMITELAMPEKTSWELASLNSVENEGIYNVETKFDKQYNRFQLDYNQNSASEGNKISHIIRQLKDKSEPIYIKTFERFVPSPEIENGRKLQSQLLNTNTTELQNYDIWLNKILRGQESGIDTDLRASNLTFQTIVATSYTSDIETLICTVELASVALPFVDISKINFEWFIGYYIILYNSTSIGSNTELIIGKITNIDSVNANKIYFECKYFKPDPLLVTVFDRVIIRKSFWTGLISLADLSGIVRNYSGNYYDKLIDYQLLTNDYGLRYPVGLKTNYNLNSNNIVQPLGFLDGMVLSINPGNPTYHLDDLISGILNLPPPSPFTLKPFGIGGSVPIEDEKYMFRLEAKYCLVDVMSTIPNNENWEFYDLIVLNPENPFNLSNLGLPDFANIVMAIESYCDYLFMGAADGFLSYISEKNIKSESNNNVFFENGSEWDLSLDQWNQFPIRENTWRGQNFELIQSIENRQLKPFPKIKHPLIDHIP